MKRRENLIYIYKDETLPMYLCFHIVLQKKLNIVIPHYNIQIKF